MLEVEGSDRITRLVGERAEGKCCVFRCGRPGEARRGKARPGKARQRGGRAGERTDGGRAGANSGQSAAKGVEGDRNATDSLAALGRGRRRLAWLACSAWLGLKPKADGQLTDAA